MGTEKKKLPDLGQVEFLSRDFLLQGWVEDPPSFVWLRLPDHIIKSVLKTKIKFRAELTKNELINDIENLVN